MKVSDFDYPLDESLIAQTPLTNRDESKLMILNRKTGAIEHKKFYEMPNKTLYFLWPFVILYC